MLLHRPLRCPIEGLVFIAGKRFNRRLKDAANAVSYLIVQCFYGALVVGISLKYTVQLALFDAFVRASESLLNCWGALFSAFTSFGLRVMAGLN
jgi:hypothetical protein